MIISAASAKSIDTKDVDIKNARTENTYVRVYILEILI